jgi:3-dehydroquinate synthase
MRQTKLTTTSGKTDIAVGERLSDGLVKLDKAPILLVDEHVLCQHYDQFNKYQCVSVPSGERYKTLGTVEHIFRELVNLEADRTALIVGVGGGLTTDVAGFVAATYLREVAFGFISTTLLGQVDASIGGKNGVNLDGYKNMVGTIRQPTFVWCDLTLLETLSRKEYISGIAEVIKYGAIRDEGFLHYLEERMPSLLDLDKGVLEEVVTTSVDIKVDIVQKDEKESDLRRLLNFGHTIGHAIERELKVLHGEAVAVGMILAARLSHSLGLLKSDGVELIERLVKAAGLPSGFDLDPDEIYMNIRKDKKKRGDDIHFVLLENLGHAIVKKIPLRDLKPILHDLC